MAPWHRTSGILVGLLAAASAAAPAPVPSPGPQIPRPKQPNSGRGTRDSGLSGSFFETRVRPLLAAKCYSCHSGQSRPVQGGLRVDSRAALLAGGVRGPSLVPGDPEHSSLLRAVRHTDPDLKMPPGARLKDAEIAALEAWIRMGAPWEERTKKGGEPKAGNAAPRPSAQHWAWIPPRVPALPRVRNTAWVRNPLDQFILARLEAKGLTPAPEADPRTLIRRATFDLTGLPPTPEEVEQFVRESEEERKSGRVEERKKGNLSAATSSIPPSIHSSFLPDRKNAVLPTAYERLVDRLLASPRYGERWGRHWLDVARYADSNGLDENLVFANAWRYRDYVIRAFNADKPYDRFVQEQIAGDLLPPSTVPGEEFDPLIATGYLSLGPKMLAEDDPVKQEEDIIDEQVDTLGKTFMGVTLGCARCHDHKFDPFPQTDYYALAGIFKSTKTMVNFQVVAEWQELPLASREAREQEARIGRELAQLRGERDRVRRGAAEQVLTAARADVARYQAAARELVAAGSADLAPALASEAAAVPAGGASVGAVEFTRGNVLKDTTGYGKGIGVLVNAGQYPNLAEYEVTLPQAGPYQLDLRYASGDSRPFRLYVNEALVLSNAAGKVTGGFFPEHQRWFAEGVFAFRTGVNRIRLERDSYFPHVSRLLLVPRPGAAVTRTAEAVAAERGLVSEFLSQAVAQLKAGTQLPTFQLPDDPTRLLPAPVQAEIGRLGERMAALEKEKPVLPRAMAVSEGKPANLPVHIRGNYLTLGRDCPRGFPVLLAGNNPPPIPPASSGRLELARWLTRPEHPLTARVFVNRVWRWHFGRGIVPSTDNFGTLGELPTHPELLDWLAARFAGVSRPESQVPSRTSPDPGLETRDAGLTPWSLKSLHRLIMLSSTYRMSSRYDAQAARVDPENQLHWRHDRRRLSAEEVRDAVVRVGGRMDFTMGGSLLKFKDREYVTSTANADPVNYQSHRRSVYLPIIRSALYDVFTAFDFGDPTVMNGDRSTTTVAPQALFMMNSLVVRDSAGEMAESLLARADLGEAARIRVAYVMCYARPPAAEETRRALEYLDRAGTALAATEPDPALRQKRIWASLCKSLMAASEFLYVE